MAPSKRARKGGASPKPSTSTSSSSSSSLPKPFLQAPDVLLPFCDTLNPKHIYVTHVDPRPRDFKRKIFLVPFLMNVVIGLFFAWRAYYITPYYLSLAASAMGYENPLTLRAADLSWGELIGVVSRRGLTFLIDFILVVFVWPWPGEFFLGREFGSPVGWRWNVGFRERELYVRRSREWDSQLGDHGHLFEEDRGGRGPFFDLVRAATDPLLLQQKTGYLLMNQFWDLDWDAMVAATSLVDKKLMGLHDLDTVVLLHSKDHGWVTLDDGNGPKASEDEKRKQVLAFQKALTEMGKEDLFYRWIEIVQFETSQPGGFSPAKQEVVAEQIRELFQSNDVDFDKVWRGVFARSFAPQTQTE